MIYKNRLNILYITLLILSAVNIFSQNNTKDIIVIGSDNNYPPFEFINQDNIPEGFNIDIARAVAKTMGLNIEFELKTWAEIKKDFNSGKIDMLSGAYYSDERAEKYLFTSPFIVMHQAVFVRKNSPEYIDLESLKGKSVIVQNGDIMHEYFLSNNITEDLFAVESPAEALSLLSSGKYDFAVTSRITGLYWLKKLRIKNVSTGNNLIIEKQQSINNYSFAVSKDNTSLFYILNEGLVIIKQTGLYDEIYKKWFGDLDPDISILNKSIKIIFLSAAAISFILVFFILWSWSLKKTVEARTSALEKEIKEHRKSDLDLNESRELYKTLYSESTEGVILIDAETGNIIHFNRRASEILGVTLIKFKERSFRNVFNFNDADDLDTHFDRIKKSGFDSFETSGSTKAGEIRNIIINSKLIKINNKELIQSIWIDITEKKIIEEKILHSGKLEAVGTLAGGIAHDFNNILTAIIGYSEIAKMRMKENDPGWNELGEIQKAGDRAKDIVNQILLFSRKNTPEKEIFKLSEILDESLNLLRSAIPKSIKLIDKSDKKIDNIYANKTQIYQIFLNLCSNAAHAMEEKGGIIKIEIKNKVLEKQKYVFLRISDTGPGIDDKIAEKIFDPYFTTKETGKGSGLGLSVVRGIVEKNNGFIEVDNNAGNGAAFNIFFPSCSAESMLKAEKLIEAEGGNETILILDDEESIIDIISIYLKSSGYSVILENSSRNAVNTFINNKDFIDMVITDQMMPELSGLEFADIVKKNKNIPVLLMTGYSEKVNSPGFNNEIVDKLLFKPIKRKELLHAVRNLLNKKWK